MGRALDRTRLRANEHHLAATPSRFATGDDLTMADLFLVPQVRNAERHGADLSACPNVLRIYATCMQLPDAIASAPDRVAAAAPAPAPY